VTFSTLAGFSELTVLAGIGPSGVGKSLLARKLTKWATIDVDRILWSTVLAGPLRQSLEALALDHPNGPLAKLLKTGSIRIDADLAANLGATAQYMGMLGEPLSGGTDLEPFIARMSEYRVAERIIMSTLERELAQLYFSGVRNVYLDTSGSLCQIIDWENFINDPVLNFLSDCYVVYLRPTEDHIEELVQRNRAKPKPIFYPPEFLEAELPEVLSELRIDSVTQAHPDTLAQRLFPRLIRARLPLYERIVNSTDGVTIPMDDFNGLDEDEVMELIAEKLAPTGVLLVRAD
jgi:hypothetical protein